MTRFTVDTNVPIVANGSPDPKDQAYSPSPRCRLAAVEFLQDLLRRGCVILDLAGEIQTEYHRYLSPRGQPGVGDRFYLAVLIARLVASRELISRGMRTGNMRIFLRRPDLLHSTRATENLQPWPAGKAYRWQMPQIQIGCITMRRLKQMAFLSASYAGAIREDGSRND